MPWGGSLECLGEIGQVAHLAADGSPPASVNTKVLGTWKLMVGMDILDTEQGEPRWPLELLRGSQAPRRAVCGTRGQDFPGGPWLRIHLPMQVTRV